MAIFRAGKRIGPFDIRGGISRGDFKSSAYHKTDRDPRFRMQANVDNTIGRFRSAMAAAEGYARPSRFAIRVFPPVSLKDQLGLSRGSVYSDGQVKLPTDSIGDMNGPDAGFDQPVSGKYMNDLLSTYGRQINIHCDSVVMPTKTMQTQDVQYGSEPVRSMVQTHEFPGTITASFYADKYLRERQFFEAWQKMCVGEHTHKANYYDSYVGKMHIYQLGADGEVNRDMPTYAVEAMEVYPQQIGSIEYGYGKTNEVVKINVEFAYKYWRNMASTTSSLSFGRHNQAPAEIKARNSGLFGMLPPELQRVGRDVFGQARTVLNPIGRIFGGKVFPPFT
jgi:hypothetical protein